MLWWREKRFNKVLALSAAWSARRAIAGTRLRSFAIRRDALAEFRHQEAGPGVLRRENNNSDQHEEQTLQERQKHSDEAEEDETPTGDQDENSLTARLHENL